METTDLTTKASVAAFAFSGKFGKTELTVPHKIVSAILTESGTLEIVRQYPSNFRYLEGGGPPDFVEKEIYRCQGDKIVLAGKVAGKHTPAYVVQEKIEF